MAVSYTHLDVYKRQVVDSSEIQQYILAAPILRNTYLPMIPDMIDKVLMPYTGSVSYTHLDVYKRQFLLTMSINSFATSEADLYQLFS